MADEATSFTGNLTSYPKTRSSGLTWLGDVPSHWRIRRFKHLLRETDGRSVSGTERLLRVSQYTGVTPRGRSEGAEAPASRATSLIGYKKVRARDLVVNIMLAWNGSLGVAPSRGIVSPAYCVYRFGSDHDPRYFHHLLRSPRYKNRIKAVSRGVVESRLRLYTDDLYRLEGLVPPPAEQTAIVRFLDYVDRRIRRYIRAKEKLIALLEEQKQAVIHQAVTGQIDVRTGRPYPVYKDSGIEWLGDVPAHWERISLGALAESVQTGPFGSQLHAAEYRDGGVPVINPSHMLGGSVAADRSVAVSQEKARELSRHQLEAGDIVMARRGELGRCALVEQTEAGWLCGTGSLRIRPNKRKVASNYLAHVLSAPSTREALRLWSLGATMANLNAGLVSRLPVFTPPLAEQPDIVESLQRTNDETTAGIGNAHRQIDLLREYRTRLIANVVTGKLDVREAAASLPEVEPLQEVDDLERTADTGAPFCQPETA